MFKFPILLRLLRDPGVASEFSMKDWESVISQARRAGLLLMLETYLRSKSTKLTIPDQIVRLLRAEYCLADKQSASVVWEAGKLITVLQGIGLKPIFLKGAAYILADLPVAKGRLLSDIDILVPATSIRSVELALTANGWMASDLDSYDQHYFRAWMHEIPPLVHVKSNTTLDVHHTILALTAKSSPDADLLIADAVAAPFEGAYVLSPEDMVLHSAAHLFSEGELELGLKGLIDIERLITGFVVKDPDFWQSLILRAKRHQLCAALYSGLRYCQMILDLEVPAQVIHQLEMVPGIKRRPFLDFLYRRALMPDHPEVDGTFTALSRFLLYVRGHYLRMPVRLLVPHLVRKAWKNYNNKKQTRQVSEPTQTEG